MKISRSKKIEIIVALTLFIFIFVYAFVFASNKNISETYALSEEDNKIIEDTTTKEEKIEAETDEQNITQNVEPKEEIVYENMTLNQLSDKLNRTLASNLSGYGNFVANYSLEKGVDPYLATAIMMHETGCEWGCSSLVRN